MYTLKKLKDTTINTKYVYYSQVRERKIRKTDWRVKEKNNVTDFRDHVFPSSFSFVGKEQELRRPYVDYKVLIHTPKRNLKSIYRK